MARTAELEILKALTFRLIEPGQNARMRDGKDAAADQDARHGRTIVADGSHSILPSNSSVSD